MATREMLERAEQSGLVYNGELQRAGTLGTYWIDSVSESLYEYETDNLDLSSKDLSDVEIAQMEPIELVQNIISWIRGMK